MSVRHSFQAGFNPIYQIRNSIRNDCSCPQKRRSLREENKNDVCRSSDKLQSLWKALVCTALTLQLTTPHVTTLTRALCKRALNSSVTQSCSKNPVEFWLKMCTSGNKCSYLSKNCHMVTNCWHFKNSSYPTIKSQLTAWSVCWFMDLFMWILQNSKVLFQLKLASSLKFNTKSLHHRSIT